MKELIIPSSEVASTVLASLIIRCGRAETMNEARRAIQGGGVAISVGNKSARIEIESSESKPA